MTREEAATIARRVMEGPKTGCAVKGCPAFMLVRDVLLSAYQRGAQEMRERAAGIATEYAKAWPDSLAGAAAETICTLIREEVGPDSPIPGPLHPPPTDGFAEKGGEIRNA